MPMMGTCTIVSTDDEGITVERDAPIFGKNQQHLPITAEQLELWILLGGNIQDMLPQLNRDQAEFLLSGCPSDDAWEGALGKRPKKSE